MPLCEQVCIYLMDQIPALDGLEDAGNLNELRGREFAGELAHHGILIPLQGVITRSILEQLALSRANLYSLGGRREKLHVGGLFIQLHILPVDAVVSYEGGHHMRVGGVGEHAVAGRLRIGR